MYSSKINMTQSCHISWDIIFNINKTGVRFMRKADDILDYCIKNLKGTVLIETWGEKAVFYNPENIYLACPPGLVYPVLPVLK